MTTHDLIDRINDDIVEVISHYVELKQAGRSYKAPCPFHNEKTASFMVSPQKGIYKCFGCGEGGDAIQFIQKHENVEFMEALKIGAEKLKIDYQPNDKDFNKDEYIKKESLSLLAGKVAAYFNEQLTKDLVAAKYLKERDIVLGDDNLFGIGYAPAGNTLLSWANSNNINVNQLKELGLIAENDQNKSVYDFFRSRIIFPSYSKTGKVIGFSGRFLGTDKNVPKYLNSPDSTLFHKGNELFALNLARQKIRNENRAFLVEGPIDVIRFHKIGVTNTVAPCGTALTIEQARLLRNYSKNVTLVYDGDQAGRNAMNRNGEMLVKEQFNVMVIILPENQDPDSFFTSHEFFETYKEENHTDFIIQKAIDGEKKATNPAFKGELIKDIASLISRYDEPSLHEVYIEAVSKIIKPKKAWQDQIKTLTADKAVVEKKVYIPKTVSADEFLERGFYVEHNCYYFADKKGTPVLRSNCFLSPLFHIESTINSKRLYEVRNVKGEVRVVEIPQRDLVSLSAFQVHIESLGNFWWDGSQADLNRLKRWLYEKTETCREITQLGWQKEGFFAWGNGIFNGDFIPVDQYGIARNSGISYYIPAFSSIYASEPNLFQFERKFINIESNVTLNEYAKKFVKVFGDNGKIAISFYLASLFRDIVVNIVDKFPILNMFGPKGAGKTACAESLLHFFGRPGNSPNIHNTSKPALADHVATSVNALCHIDEYRNDLEMEKREFLKGLWDGSGRTRMNMDKDKKKEMTPVQQGVVLTGQQMATADIALFTRVIFIAFTQVEFSDEEKEEYNSLKSIEKRGLTHITNRILKLRGYFKDNIKAKLKETAAEMQKRTGHAIIEDRIFNNWLVPLAAYVTLSESLELPWTNDNVISFGVKKMIAQNKEIKKNDDLGNFWKVVEFLISSNMLFEEGDYKVVVTDRFIRRWREDGKDMKEEIVYNAPKELFYLTKSRVFSLYKSQTLREGDKPLPESTVEYYLTNSKAYICDTKKEGFRKIDPKLGVQEMNDDGSKKRTSTTAMIFDLSKLNINVSISEQDAEPDGFTQNKDSPAPETTDTSLFPNTPRTPQF